MRKIVVLTGPPGSGKSTVISGLVRNHGFVFPTPHTTRQPRIGEEDGVDYYFVSRKKMTAMIKRGEFEIWTYMLANYYGYHKATYEEVIKTPKNIVLYMSGAMAIQFQRQQLATLVFLDPGDFSWAQKRMVERGDSDDIDLARRRFHSEDLYGYVPFFDLVLEVENGIEIMLEKVVSALDLKGET